MNAILQTPERLLLSINVEECIGLTNALLEVWNGLHIEDAEFETRLGVRRGLLAELLSSLQAGVEHPSQHKIELVDAWADGASVQAICVTVFGDPVDMGTEEARRFAEQILESVREAGG